MNSIPLLPIDKHKNSDQMIPTIWTAVWTWNLFVGFVQKFVHFQPVIIVVGRVYLNTIVETRQIHIEPICLTNDLRNFLFRCNNELISQHWSVNGQAYRRIRTGTSLSTDSYLVECTFQRFSKPEGDLILILLIWLGIFRSLKIVSHCFWNILFVIILFFLMFQLSLAIYKLIV